MYVYMRVYMDVCSEFLSYLGLVGYFRTLAISAAMAIRNTENNRCPGAPLTNFNDGGGGSDRGSYFIPKKNTTSEFGICLPKKSLLFLVYPQKSLSSFFAT